MDKGKGKTVVDKMTICVDNNSWMETQAPQSTATDFFIDSGKGLIPGIEQVIHKIAGVINE